MEKRGKNITINRIFLTVNPSWKDKKSVGFYIISKWTSDAAEQIGLDVKRCKITNHSIRSTAVSNLAKSGVGEHQITKITGHSNSSFISSYIKIDSEHHEALITNLRNLEIGNELRRNDTNSDSKNV